MKSKERNNILSSFSLCVVTVYFVLNSLLMIEWLNMRVTLSMFADVVFGIDLFTWHIYGAFAIISLIIKIFNAKDFGNKGTKLNIAVHSVLMLISFAEIYMLIQNGF